jgi:hypothetical protein
MTDRVVALLALALALPLAGGRPAAAGEVEKNVPFQLDQWIDLQASDGPVTLHRVRLARQGLGAKSKFMRPGNSEYLEDVQIQLEFTNDATRDWEARFDVEWADAQGVVIDGYNDKETLDSESRHDEQTVTLSTLRYGIERAKKLKIRIEFNPD